MLQYFFTYGSELPAGVGFPMYGTAHILWLLAGTGACILLLLLFRRADNEKQRKLELALGLFPVALIVLRACFLTAIGHQTVYELPLHLCALAGFLCLAHMITGKDWLGQVLYALCLPGTLLALIFPDWIYYPPVHFITIQGFLFHFGVAWYILCELSCGKIRPDIKRIWNPILFLLICVPVVYLFDRHFRTNYMFLRVPSPGSPLEWMASFMGVPGYLLGYAVMVAMVMILMYLAEIVFDKLRRIGYNKGNTEEERECD
ncbi:MAG: TIGR02206 family membrane protein [Firmicutes bacterium]|nr:TIGR02206 family membrane protein [Bacillota bacterium]